MQPVTYDAQCRKCHVLKLPEPFSDLGELSELPHSSIEKVRGVIRERLAKLPEHASADSTNAEQDMVVPHLPRPTVLTTDQEHSLAAQMDTIDHAIFGMEGKGACSHCHFIEPHNGEWQVHMTNPQLPADSSTVPEDKVGEMIPSRWMGEATFNHKSHRAIDCEQCHQARASSQTSDILMPSISVCQACHGNTTRSTAAQVRADCVLCHPYHMESTAKKFPGMPLDKLFSGTSVHSTSTAQ
jgi:predicted CXXCH cytochrome family protein